MTKRMPAFLAALSLIALVLSGCAASPGATAPVTREASGLRECSDFWGGSGDNFQVQVINSSSQRILLDSVEIDCYDWYGTHNPDRFNIDLSSGVASAIETLKVNPIAELSGATRPWNWTVSMYDSKEGFVWSGTPGARPTIAFSKTSCYTANGGMTACDGMTLCAQDPQGLRVETTVPLRNRVTGADTSLKMTTLCSSDSTNLIVFTDN